MENASKALLIAGGILIVMLIVSLLLFGYRAISDFYSSQDELKEIEDVAKFNSQFNGYDRENISGYELVSLANKVADYNYRYSIASDSANDKNYLPITLVIDFIDEDHRNQFLYDQSNIVKNNRLLRQNSYTQSASKNEIEGNIISKIDRITKIYGNMEIANKLAKNINNLIFDRAKSSYDRTKFTDDQIKGFLIDKYNAITGEHLTSYNDVEIKLIGSSADANIYKYYEFYQFKKAKFRCRLLENDNVSGRVSKLEFVFTGVIE